MRNRVQHIPGDRSGRILNDPIGVWICNGRIVRSEHGDRQRRTDRCCAIGHCVVEHVVQRRVVCVTSLNQRISRRILRLRVQRIAIAAIGVQRQDAVKTIDCPGRRDGQRFDIDIGIGHIAPSQGIGRAIMSNPVQHIAGDCACRILDGPVRVWICNGRIVCSEHRDGQRRPDRSSSVGHGIVEHVVQRRIVRV